MNPGMGFLSGKERNAVLTNAANWFTTGAAKLLTEPTRWIRGQPSRDAPVKRLPFGLFPADFAIVFHDGGAFLIEISPVIRRPIAPAVFVGNVGNTGNSSLNRLVFL